MVLCREKRRRWPMVKSPAEIQPGNYTRRRSAHRPSVGFWRFFRRRWPGFELAASGRRRQKRGTCSSLVVGLSERAAPVTPGSYHIVLNGMATPCALRTHAGAQADPF